jgi:Cu+-exporting ATPase
VDAPLVLDVQGMSCASCQSHVQEALAHVPGVARADVNLLTGEATVVLAADASAAATNATASALIEAVKDAGYDARVQSHAGEHVGGAAEGTNLGLKTAVSFVLAAASMATMMTAHHTIAPTAIGLAAALVTMGWAARHVYVRAWASVVRRAPDMSTLIALGTIASLAAAYFESVAFILAFVLLGQLLEARAKRATTRSLSELAARVPAIVHRVKRPKKKPQNDAAHEREEEREEREEEEDVAYETIVIGDRVRIRPGERVPVDGVVISGESEVDEALLTGEPMPAPKHAGSNVTGGTLNGEGTLLVSVTRAITETTLARIVRVLREAQRSRAEISRLADRVSRVFVPVVLAIAALTFVGWLAAGKEASFALSLAVSVLVIACPCAMGLAVPAAVMVATGRAAEMGILFKGGEAIERAARVNSVVLDKTGTLTVGRPSVTGVHALGEARDAPAEAELVRLVASMESPSEHPVARAIVRAAEARGIALAAPKAFVSRAGLGAEGTVGGARIAAGNVAHMRALGVDASAFDEIARDWEKQGKTVVLAAVDGALRGAFAISDEPKPHAAEAVRALVDMGIDVKLLTGDREGPARALADAIGIRDVIAGASPEEKLRVIESLVEEGRSVAMVGDGINDAAALAKATVGIAMGTGADVAVQASDVTLLSTEPMSLVRALRLARRTMRTMRMNLAWAAAYNVVGIPVAAGALYASRGLLLRPEIASAAMAASSVSVLMSSLVLRSFAKERSA